MKTKMSGGLKLNREKSKILPDLSAKCSVTITALNNYIDYPSGRNDKKCWKYVREFTTYVGNSSSKYEIEDEYEELKKIKITVARLRRSRERDKKAGHNSDAEKTIGLIQNNYDEMIELIKDIQHIAGAIEPSTSISELWTGYDIPLRKGFDKNLMGRWNCEWFNCNEKTKKQEHYSDDKVDIKTVDINTGYVYGKGISAYGENVDYTIEGRASKRKMIYLLYTSPFPFEEIFGSVMLIYRPPGLLKGWWLGTGFLNEIVGGETIWTHERCDPRGFKCKSYHGREKMRG